MIELYPIPLDDGKNVWLWCTVGKHRWELFKEGSGIWMEVPEGFITDLASIPRWAQWLVNPFDPQTCGPAVEHDWALSLRYEQRPAAGEFYRRLRMVGFPRWKCVGFFFAVLVASSDW